MYDIIIVGGGAAGLSAAITLGSSQEKFEWARSKKILIIDNNKSDLRAAKMNNAPGVPVGLSGSQLLSNLWSQLSQFKGIEILKDEVTTLSSDNNKYTITTKNNKTFETINMFLATGMQSITIKSELIESETHEAIAREGKVKYKNIDGKISDNLYAIGLAKGLQTMFAIAAGDGVDRAAKLLWQWSKKPAVPHDIV